MFTNSTSLQTILGSLLLTFLMSVNSFAQENSSSRSSDSLRLLLGLPQPKAVAQPAIEIEQDPLSELDEPLVIPASAPRGSLPSSLGAAPLSPRFETQDSMREQTQQQLNNFMRPMSEVSIDIRETNVRLPRDRSTELQNYVMNDWTVTGSPELAFWWAAPDIRYGQLYFENVALERYGQTCGPYKQVFASAGHLFCSVWAVPFQMWTAPAGSCDTPLGYCRPGSATGLYRQRFILWR
jgi:hypothetical protein